MEEYFQQKHKAQMNMAVLLFCLFEKCFSCTTVSLKHRRLGTWNLFFYFRAIHSIIQTAREIIQQGRTINEGLNSYYNCHLVYIQRKEKPPTADNDSDGLRLWFVILLIKIPVYVPGKRRCVAQMASTRALYEQLLQTARLRERHYQIRILLSGNAVQESGGLPISAA